MSIVENWLPREEQMTYHVEVSGVEPMRLSYNPTAKFQPVIVSFNVGRIGGQDWSISPVRLVGRKYKRDGTLGMAMVSDTLMGRELPDWLQDIVDRASPRTY